MRTRASTRRKTISTSATITPAIPKMVDELELQSQGLCVCEEVDIEVGVSSIELDFVLYL